MCREDKLRVDKCLDEIARLKEIIAALKVYQGIPITEAERRAVAESKGPLRFFAFRWRT